MKGRGATEDRRVGGGVDGVLRERNEIQGEGGRRAGEVGGAVGGAVGREEDKEGIKNPLVN